MRESTRSHHTIPSCVCRNVCVSISGHHTPIWARVMRENAGGLVRVRSVCWHFLIRQLLKTKCGVIRDRGWRSSHSIVPTRVPHSSPFEIYSGFSPIVLKLSRTYFARSFLFPSAQQLARSNLDTMTITGNWPKSNRFVDRQKWWWHFVN